MCIIICYLLIMTSEHRFITLKHFLISRSMPRALIEIIYTYSFEQPYELIFRRCKIDTNYVIDNSVYVRYYDYEIQRYVYELAFENDMRCLSCGRNEYVISFKHKITITNTDYISLGKYLSEYGFTLCIDGRDVASLIPVKIKYNRINDYAIYDNVLYVSTHDSDITTIFKINLRTQKYDSVIELSKGKLFVSYSYVCTYNDSTNILCMYNKNNEKITNRTCNVDKLVHLTDYLLYGVSKNDYLQIEFTNEMNKQVKNYKDVPIKEIYFGDNNCYVLCDSKLRNNNDHIQVLICGYKI
jgi:hypothetical protein